MGIENKTDRISSGGVSLLKIEVGRGISSYKRYYIILAFSPLLIYNLHYLHVEDDIYSALLQEGLRG